MRSLITGGAGHLGRELARLLTDREVATFDIAPSVQTGCTSIQGNLSVASEVLQAVRDFQPEEIFHLGGLLSASVENNPATAMKVNVDGTYHVLEAARESGVKRVVFASSYGTFGTSGGTILRDDSLQRPTLLYGAQKLFGEHLGMWYRRRFGLDFRAIRYPQVIGRGIRSTWHWAPEMIEDVLAGHPHTSTWAFPASRNLMLSLRDAARATAELMNAPAENMKTACYNVAGIGQSIFASELRDYLLAQHPGADIILKDGPLPQDADRETFEDSAARAEWGWRPMDDTLERIISSMSA